MYPTAPEIICNSDPDRTMAYGFDEVPEGFIFGYELSPCVYVKVRCHCGREHTLPPGVLVQEAREAGFVFVMLPSPSLDEVFRFGIDIMPVWVDGDRPLSPADQVRLETGTAELNVELDDVLGLKAEQLIAETASQLSEMGTRGIMSALFEA
jgi:hypothetical protein